MGMGEAATKKGVLGSCWMGRDGKALESLHREVGVFPRVVVPLERVFPGSFGIHGVWLWGKAALSWFGGGSWSSGGLVIFGFHLFVGA